jgi:hypothetical protein
MLKRLKRMTKWSGHCESDPPICAGHSQRRINARKKAAPGARANQRSQHNQAATGTRCAVGTQADASNAAEALANSISVGMQRRGATGRCGTHEASPVRARSRRSQHGA